MSLRSRSSLRRRVQLGAFICLATATLTGARSSWAADESARGALNTLFGGMNVLTVDSPGAAAIVRAIMELQKKAPAHVEDISGSGQLVGAQVVIDRPGEGFLAAYVQGRRDTGGLDRPEYLTLSFGYPAAEQLRTAIVSVGNFNWDTKAHGPTRDFSTFSVRTRAGGASGAGKTGSRAGRGVHEQYIRWAIVASHDGPNPMLRALDGNAASSGAGSASRAFSSFCRGLRGAGLGSERAFIGALLRAARQGEQRQPHH